MNNNFPSTDTEGSENHPTALGTSQRVAEMCIINIRGSVIYKLDGLEVSHVSSKDEIKYRLQKLLSLEMVGWGFHFFYSVAAWWVLSTVLSICFSTDNFSFQNAFQRNSHKETGPI